MFTGQTLTLLHLAIDKTLAKIAFVKRDYFLSVFVYLAAVGCPDPLPPEGAWMRRRGERGEQLVDITCNSSIQSWHLVCRGTEWVGEVGNCSRGQSRLTCCHVCNYYID